MSSDANVAAASSFMSRRVSDQSKRLDVLLEVLRRRRLGDDGRVELHEVLESDLGRLLLWALAIFVVSGPDNMSEEPWPPEPIGE